jgi:hypothetical protein
MQSRSMGGGIIRLLDVSVELTLGAIIDRINSKNMAMLYYRKKYWPVDGKRWRWKFDSLAWHGLHVVLLGNNCNKMRTWVLICTVIFVVAWDHYRTTNGHEEGFNWLTGMLNGTSVM